jgi:hypothetical protein
MDPDNYITHFLLVQACRAEGHKNAAVHKFRIREFQIPEFQIIDFQITDKLRSCTPDRDRSQ